LHRCLTAPARQLRTIEIAARSRQRRQLCASRSSASAVGRLLQLSGTYSSGRHDRFAPKPNGTSGSAYITPPYGLRAAGPLMTGGCVGAASGAGIRFWKAGIRGAGEPRRVVGLRTKPPRFANPPPCPKPPRAKPGVDATTQAAATNIAAKTRFMIVIPHFASPLDAVESNHPRTTTFSLRCLALSGLALIRRLMC